MKSKRRGKDVLVVIWSGPATVLIFQEMGRLCPQAIPKALVRAIALGHRE